MPIDEAAIVLHATAVAIEGRALLIRGPSKAGKSRLAVALCAASTPARPIVLVGDDRVILEVRRDRSVIVRPHPRIAGFIERRGLGLVAMPFHDMAPLAGIVDLAPATNLAPATKTCAAVQNLPALILVDVIGATERAAAVLSWWRANPGGGPRRGDPCRARQKRHSRRESALDRDGGRQKLELVTATRFT